MIALLLFDASFPLQGPTFDIVSAKLDLWYDNSFLIPSHSFATHPTTSLRHIPRSSCCSLAGRRHIFPLHCFCESHHHLFITYSGSLRVHFHSDNCTRSCTYYNQRGCVPFLAIIPRVLNEFMISSIKALNA
jgi:hypothetical protein